MITATQHQNDTLIVDGSRRNMPFFSRALIQTKLSVNTPGDACEREADAVADKMMGMKDPFSPLQRSNTFFIPAAKPIQRKHHGTDELDDEKLHRKEITPVQRKCAACEEENHVNRKESPASEAQRGGELDSYVGSLGSSGQTLPASSRQFFEPRFGQDFSNVRVHTDAAAAKSAQSINALAYTTGNNIVFNQGQYAPNSGSGQLLMAHELTHVVRQDRQAVVRRQAACINTNNAEGLWASQHDGKIFKTGEGVNDHNEPNEVILWNFCVGETELRAQHKTSLLSEIPRWKQMLVGSPGANATRSDLKINISGASSSSGNIQANEDLALGRANALKDFLISEGIPAKFISAAGVGSRVPLADDTSPENKARNRRVELWFLTPTTTADITGALVAANVSKLKIGPQATSAGPPKFDDKKNVFFRTNPAMIASAEVDLVGFAGDSIGFYQLLLADTRIGLYESADNGTQLLLDYGRCNTSLPCRDVEDATSLFSVDSRSLFLNKTGSVSGNVGISDRPGVGFPLRYPNPVKGPFEFIRYFWLMNFDLILGIRSSQLFMPLQSAKWSTASSEDVDIVNKKTSGMAPVAVHSPFVAVSASDKKGELDAAFTGPTCRLMARSREVDITENVCRPIET